MDVTGSNHTTIDQQRGAIAEFKALMQLARERELSNSEESAMPLVRWLHDTWREIHERGAAPSHDATPTEQLRHDLARAVYGDLRAPANFDHASAPEALRCAYLELEAWVLLEDSGTDQWGRGSVLSALRHAALNAVAGEDGIMPREIRFFGTGIGYRDVPLIATFPAPCATAHLGPVGIRFADVPDAHPAHLTYLPTAQITGYRPSAPSIEVLGRLHRFSRYGEGMVTFGNWFSADGEGRELLAAMIDGLANRVLPDIPNGMGGTSPQFALTEAGVEFVISHPKLAQLFDHYNEIEQSTAFLVDGRARVPFDIHTGAILGRLETPGRGLPAYVTKSDRAGLNAGREYSGDDLGFLMLRGIERQRVAAIQREDHSPIKIERYSEEEFDRQFGLVNGSRSGTTSYEYDEVKGMDPRHVWSLVEGDDDDGVAYALPGFHRVNNIGYTVTERPWAHENIEAVYMASMDDAHDMRP